jgi:hypothetical protein
VLANPVPAAAVTQKALTLFSIIGCKGYVGCFGMDFEIFSLYFYIISKNGKIFREIPKKDPEYPKTV